MSGFDTSQPVTDEAVLKDVDDAESKKASPTDAADAESKKASPTDTEDAAPPEELDDATPGPR